jgi:hypothetical protein
MGLSRAPISERDRRFVIGRSGGCCNKCKEPVFVDNEFGEKARLGDDAHIWSYSDDGPRGAGNKTLGERNERTNVILLCKNCHSLVDQQPIKYDDSVLTKMREDHYAWVRQSLGAGNVAKPKLHYILYLNLPRVDMYAAANSIALPHTDLGSAKSFRDLGIGAGRVMTNYTHVLNAEEMRAYSLDEAFDLSALDEGTYCLVQPMDFRTVAIGKSADLQAAWASGKSIVYRKFGDWTLQCLIDPRWLTTSTAEVTLTSGRARLCGVIRINRIDPERSEIKASPLFLAHPSGPFDVF